MAEETNKGVKVKAVHAGVPEDLFYAEANKIEVNQGHLEVKNRATGIIAIFAPGNWMYAQVVQ